eukprot:SAG31_NODE_1481_length_8176_cov_3.282531_1_plen_373_part_10
MLALKRFEFAESPLYGVPSSNHPELALPYFDTVMAALPLARQRAARRPWLGGMHGGHPGLPGQEVDEYTIFDKGGYDGVNFPGHIGPFGLHDWTDRGQRSNGAFAAVPFIEYWESTGNSTWLNATGYPFVDEVARFYSSYMVKEDENETGTAWMAWPRHLEALPNMTEKVLKCPQYTLGALGAECIVPRHLAGKLCAVIAGCTGITYSSDTGWNQKFPGACMLTRGPPIRSGPIGSDWDVKSWVSYTRPEGARAHIYTWNVPKSCSMELCALGRFGATLEQSNPTLELALVRRVLTAAIRFSSILYPRPDSKEGQKIVRWQDIVEHLAPLPLTTTETGWVWAETNVTSMAAFGANQWYPVDYFSPIHPGSGVS